MNLSAPHEVVMQKSEGAVLKVLAQTNAPLSGREVARLGNSPRSTIARALKRLVVHGLVNAEEAGRGVVTLYTLNRKHVACEPVLALLRLRQDFFKCLEDHLRTWSIPPYHASVFGSAARGDGNVESDIDVFLIRPPGMDGEATVWRRQVYNLQSSVLMWTGNQAGIVEVSIEEAERLKHDRPPVMAELERDAVTVVGPTPTEIFEAITQ